MGERILERSFFDRRAETVAPELLGRVLRHGSVAVRLTEVEAYAGADDPAAHSYRGRTRRNAVMFGPPGHVYVYFTYGMHFCANLVCLPDGTAGAVLLRAGQVIEGEAEARAARERRTRKPYRTAFRDLARGPARLCVALGLNREHNGMDCCSADGELRVLEGDPVPRASVRNGPRTGVAGGAETPWRFWIDGDPTVSPYRRHVPRRRAGQSSGDAGG